MPNDQHCEVCQGTLNPIFACTGAVDTERISDLAARILTADGMGRLFSLAGIAGRVEPIMEQTKAADKILAIDGCLVDLARKTLEQTKLTESKQLRATDSGIEKGKSPVRDENIAIVAEKTEVYLA